MVGSPVLPPFSRGGPLPTQADQQQRFAAAPEADVCPHASLTVSRPWRSVKAEVRQSVTYRSSRLRPSLPQLQSGADGVSISALYEQSENAMAKRRATGAETGSVPDPFAVLRPRLVRALVGFSRDLPENWHQQELETQGRPEPAEFPVPDLVLFALRNVLGFSWYGPREKVRWSVYARSPVCRSRSKCGSLGSRSARRKGSRSSSSDFAANCRSR